MNKQWFKILGTLLIGMAVSCETVFAVGRDHYSNQNLDLPLDQIAQNGKQQTKNDNQKLFQDDQVGDIGKERQQLEKQGRQKVFQTNQKSPDQYTQKNIFIKEKQNAHSYDYTKKKTPTSHFHFSYWIVVGCAILIGLIITWRMSRSGKREQRSANHSGITE